MKLFAVNGSPRGKDGNTAVILDAFLEGVRKAGGEAEVLDIKDLDIGPCKGCVACWTKTPGKCVQEDDMVQVHSGIEEADVLILAAPVYVDSFPGPMKTMLDRMLPTLEPFFEVRSGRTRHPVREEYRGKKAVLVSVCGLYEMDNFDVITDHFKAFCGNLDAEAAGMVLRPHGGGLTFMKEKGRLDGVLDACREAGRELFEKGRISDEVQEKISAPLFSKEQHIDIINTSFRRAIDKRL